MTRLIELEYPGLPDESGEPPRIRAIQVSLMDVRAADDIRISYDFDRDGWKIEQERIITAPSGAYRGSGAWVESAFVEAWANESKNTAT